MLVAIALSTPQPRPPRPPRPDELAASPKSTAGKRRPPPPPGSGSGVSFSVGQDIFGGTAGSVTGSAGVPVKSNTRWIWDDNCKNDRPPFDLGRWVQVRYDECPIAFDDPEFDFHDNFCE